MEDKKTIIDSIRDLIFAEEAPIVEQKFEDLKDVDGNILRVESLEIGQPVMIITEEGEELSPEAEYTLEDGRRVIVDMEGLITEVIEAEAEDEEEAPEDAVEEEMNEEEAKDNRDVYLEDKINATIARKTKELEAKLDNLLEKFEAITDKVKALSNEPAEGEIKVEKAGFKKENKTNSALNELRKFRN